MKKIGITGVHGSGKTTKAQELTEYYSDMGFSVNLVKEVAREVEPYYKNNLRTFKAQNTIWNKQIMEESFAKVKNPDIIICDRTIMDNFIYAYALFDTIKYTEKEYLFWVKRYHIATKLMETYDYIIRMPINLEYLKEDNPIRSKDIQYAKRIDYLFDTFMQEYVSLTMM